MALYRRVRRKLRRVLLAPPSAVRRRLGVARLRRTSNPTLRRIGEAISAASDGTVDDGGRRWTEAIERVRADLATSQDIIEIPAAELSGDPADKRIAVETVRHACGRSKPPLWCRFLFELVRELKPATCVELGTCVGMSAAYQAAALETNDRGRLVTIESVGGHLAIARRNFEQLGLDRVDVVHGRFEDVLADVLRAHAPIDVAFVDGNHREQATLQYAATIKPFLAGEAVIVFDDISFSDEMERAWHTLREDPAVGAAIDLGPVGLCVYRSGGGPKLLFDVPLELKPRALDRTWLDR